MAVLNNTGIRAGASGAAGGGDSGYQIEKSLRFNKDDSAYLNWTPGSASNRSTFTYSSWIKYNSNTTLQNMLNAGNNSTVGRSIMRYNASEFQFLSSGVGGVTAAAAYSATVYRDPSAWYHVVWAFDTTQTTDTDRIKLYVNGVQQTFRSYTAPAEDGVFSINNNSLHKISGAVYTTGQYFDGYMAEIHFIDGLQLDATSFAETNEDTGQWIPKDCSEDLTYGTNGFYLKFDNTSDLGEDSSGNDNDWTANNLTAIGKIWSDYGDSTAYWATHVFDSTVDTGTHGEGSPWATWTAPTGQGITWNQTLEIRYLQNTNGGPIAFNSTNLTLSDTGHLNYTTVDISSQVTSPLTSISLNRSGGNGSETALVGIYADGVLVSDVSLTETDLLSDSPSTYDDEGNGVGNYCTLNPLAMASGLSLSNGNLDAAGAAVYGCVTSTIFAQSGKYYFEFTLNTYQNDTAPGVVSTDANPHTDYLGAQASSVGYLADGRVFQSGSSTSYSSYVAGDVIGVAFDVDTGKIWFAKNNTWLNSGDPAAGSNPVNTISGGKPLGAGYRGVGSGAGSFNFGQRDFEETVPTGFKALNTYNLNATTILSGEYEGNGDADGPAVWMNATPATLKIGTSDPPTSLVTFDPDDVDPLAGGFKIRNSSTNNGSGTTYYWLATTNRAFKYANAQSNE